MQELLNRYTNWVRKMGDGTRIGGVIDLIHDGAVGNFSVAASKLYNLTLAVAGQLSQDGIVPTVFWAYHAYSKQLQRYQGKYGGTTLLNIAQGLKDKWTSDGINGPEAILVANLLGIVVT